MSGFHPETHKRGFLKKAPFETAKTLLYGFWKPMLPCAVAAYGFAEELIIVELWRTVKRR
jgi:hypothetical protein